MIPIALSYRIIKNTKPLDQQERKLESLDISLFKSRNESHLSLLTHEEDESGDDLSKLKRAVRISLKEEMESERQALLIEAREEIEKEKRKVLDEAYRKGYEDGLHEGREEGYNETVSFRENAIEMLKDAEAMAKEYLEMNEEKIIRLSSRIAEKIVQVTINHSDESVMLLARPILQEYGKTENVIITCHPGRLEFMKEQCPELQMMCPNAHILVLQDKNLEDNDMVIENENQITDLSIKKQIARFIELATE